MMKWSWGRSDGREPAAINGSEKARPATQHGCTTPLARRSSVQLTNLSASGFDTRMGRDFNARRLNLGEAGQAGIMPKVSTGYGRNSGLTLCA
jgi:hypothetical protein